MALRSSLVALSLVGSAFAALGAASPLLPQPQAPIHADAGHEHSARSSVAANTITVVRINNGRVFYLARQ